MIPTFAVVGHPNKGKSSIVAALAQDDSVRISAVPGTTVACREFPMRVDGEVLYKLIDTPGFQRARQVLAWMRERETTAAERPRIVREFVDAHRNGDLYADECELLSPLLDGAGILYVIDGSRPFGSEYQAEMEILRWTGQPSMALINMIGAADYTEQWSGALAQYFRIVRRFNAFTARFEKQLGLLRAFGELNEDWREALSRAIASLERERHHRRQLSAYEVGEMIIDVLTSSVTKKIAVNTAPDKHRPRIEASYRDSLQKRERRCRDAVERCYDYHRLVRQEADLDVMGGELFSQKTWLMFGLSKTQLLVTGAAGGGAIGSGLDIALGGASLMLGAGIGALVGGVTAWYSQQRLSDARVLGLPLGGTELRVGPMSDRNFPYVLLGRALFHHRVVTGRTHAHREHLDVKDAAAASAAGGLSGPMRKRFEQRFAALRRGGQDIAGRRWRNEFAALVEAAIVHSSVQASSAETSTSQ